MNRFEHRSLAWSLVDLAAPHLTPDARLWLYAEIGAGELESATLTLLDCCMRSGVNLTPAVSMAVRDWLYGYTGTVVAARFQPYIPRI